jgi:hypothetical protein
MLRYASRQQLEIRNLELAELVSSYCFPVAMHRKSEILYA